MRKIVSKLVKRVFQSERVRRRLAYTAENAEAFSDFKAQESMLADRPPVDAYHKAITKYTQKGERVVDLGTGTGILAFFAASKSPAKVYAVEHGRIIEVARAAAVENGIENVEFFAGHSKTFSPEEKVDIIIHEQMGSPLFGEHMITNVVDLRDRILKPGGRIFPAKFEWYIEPIQLKEANTIPFAWEQSVYGLTFKMLRDRAKDLGYYYRRRRIAPYMIENFLCKPEPVLRIDLETIRLDEVPREISYKRPAVRKGRLDGFCAYFTASFDDEISLTTDPFFENRAVSWPLRFFRVDSREYEPGETVEFNMQIDDLEQPETYRWW